MSALPRSERPCESCGVAMTVIEGAKYQPRYCSSACHGVARRVPVSERFWRRVQVGHDCWLWTGSRDQRGYGIVVAKVAGERQVSKAHRVAYELEVGPIPDGLHVLHSCDNPPCVRPSHLRVGTHSENMRDMADRHRAASPGARLDEDAVRQVRRMVAAGASQREVSRAFGIDPSAISLIVNRKTWRHVGT